MTKCLFFSECPNIDGHCYWVSIPVSIIKWPFNQITNNQIDFKENNLASAERYLVCLSGSVNQPVISWVNDTECTNQVQSEFVFYPRLTWSTLRALPVSAFPWALMRFSGMLCSQRNEYTSVFAQLGCHDVMYSPTIHRQMIPRGTFLISNVQAIQRVQFQLYQNAAGEEPSGICWCRNSGGLRTGKKDAG